MNLNPEKKKSGLNGIRTHDLRDTGAVLYQLSSGPAVVSSIFHVWICVKYFCVQFSAVIMMSHQCWRRFIEMALTYTRLLAGCNWNWSTWCMNEWRSVRQLFSPRRTNGIQCAINNFYSFRLSLNILDESVFVTRILRRIVTHSEIRLV